MEIKLISYHCGGEKLSVKVIHALHLKIVQIVLEAGVWIRITVSKMIDISLLVKAERKWHNIVLSVIRTTIIINVFVWYSHPVTEYGYGLEFVIHFSENCNALHFALCYRHVCLCVCLYSTFVDLRKTVWDRDVIFSILRGIKQDIICKSLTQIGLKIPRTADKMVAVKH